MVKVFIPKEKTKQEKTSARGFWLSPEGKLYYDYIEVKNILTYSSYYIETVRQQKRQEAIFFINDNIGNVFYNENKIEVLKNRKVFSVDKSNKKELRQLLKSLLKVYSGLTVYNQEKYYIIEVFYND
jgi:uncharacterized protein YbcV (DUF1398 family)